MRPLFPLLLLPVFGTLLFPACTRPIGTVTPSLASPTRTSTPTATDTSTVGTPATSTATRTPTCPCLPTLTPTPTPILPTFTATGSPTSVPPTLTATGSPTQAPFTPTSSTPPPTSTRTPTPTLTRTYTPVCAYPFGALGDPTDGTTYTSVVTQVVFVKGSLSQSGLVDLIRVHTSCNYGLTRVALYSDNGANAPGALIVESQPTGSCGWTNVDIPDTTLAPGDYWVAAQSTNGFRFKWGVSGVSHRLDWAFGTFPASGAGSSPSTVAWDLYAPLCVLPGTPSPTPIPPTFTPTRTLTPVPCALLPVFCASNTDGTIAAGSYPAGSPGTEAVTCAMIHLGTTSVVTNTLDASTDPEDIYTVGLDHFGQTICVILDSFDNGTAANQFTLSAYHCLGYDRTGPVGSWCGGAVQRMTTLAMGYDSNVTVRVRAQQGAGPYRLIILKQ